jgi:hypothetical protein
MLSFLILEKINFHVLCLWDSENRFTVFGYPPTILFLPFIFPKPGLTRLNLFENIASSSWYRISWYKITRRPWAPQFARETLWSDLYWSEEVKMTNWGAIGVKGFLVDGSQPFSLKLIAFFDGSRLLELHFWEMIFFRQKLRNAKKLLFSEK